MLGKINQKIKRGDIITTKRSQELVQINYEGNQTKFGLVRKRKEEIKERTVREIERNEESMQGGNKRIGKSQ